MKQRILSIILLIAALAPEFDAPAATRVDKFGVDTEVCDPVLIYTGGLSKRARWTKANIRPYIVNTYADGHKDWFFDTFIFNETNWYDSKTGETRVLCNAGGGQLPATQADWLAWLDVIFGASTDLRALDDEIGNQIAVLGTPPLQHKVLIGMCYPCKDGRGTPGKCEWKKFDWGQIDGKDMDFTLQRHRIAAATWFVDEALRRFNEAGFKNIELAGFYCTEETMYTIGDIADDINDYIHSLGLRSYWIPYWANNDQYAFEWKDKYHFDMTWRQPNYFFYTSSGSLPPMRQLTDCIESSKEYGLGLELEYETSSTSNGLHSYSPKMHQRFIDYIDKFEEYGVWAESGVAHYFGSKGLLDVRNNGDEVDRATIDRLADIVAARRKAFSGVEETEITLPEAPFALAGNGEIYITEATPEGAVYNLAGTQLHSGSGTFVCPAGIYIATNGKGKAVKLRVY